MRHSLPLLALAGCLFATPGLADVKEDYMAACMKASNNNTELCTCKTAEAPKYADDEMLGFLIINFEDTAKFTAMVNNGEVPKAVVDKWPTYVMKTNLVCLPDNS